MTYKDKDRQRKEAQATGLKIDDLPDSVFPSKPSDFCLICGARRKRHSWFCGKKCEQVFIEEYVKELL